MNDSDQWQNKSCMCTFCNPQHVILKDAKGGIQVLCKVKRMIYDFSGSQLGPWDDELRQNLSSFADPIAYILKGAYFLVQNFKPF